MSVFGQCSQCVIVLTVLTLLELVSEHFPKYLSTLFCRRDADLDVPVRLRGHGEAELEDNFGPDLATPGASLETGWVSGQGVRIITGKNSSINGEKLEF